MILTETDPELLKAAIRMYANCNQLEYFDSPIESCDDYMKWLFEKVLEVEMLEQKKALRELLLVLKTVTTNTLAKTLDHMSDNACLYVAGDRLGGALDGRPRFPSPPPVY